MLFNTLFKTAVLVVSISAASAAPQASPTRKIIASEAVGTANQTAVRAPAPVVATVAATVGGVTVLTNTTVKSVLNPPSSSSSHLT
jgi:hypothetical protein